MNTHYRNDDPPADEDAVIGLRCKHCGRFVNTKAIKWDGCLVDDGTGKYYEHWPVFRCTKCGEVPEGDTHLICV